MRIVIKDKRKVICIIAILTIIFFCLLGIILVDNLSGGNIACVYSEGKLIKTIELDSCDEQTFTVESSDGGYNIIEVKNGTVSITDADCPDKICVHTSPISDGVQPIVCMPHKLVVRIESKHTEYSHDS